MYSLFFYDSWNKKIINSYYDFNKLALEQLKTPLKNEKCMSNTK